VKLAMLADVMELLKVQRRTIICWYSSMLRMGIYMIIYQKILRKSLGKIKSNHLFRFQEGKVLISLLIIIIVILMDT